MSLTSFHHIAMSYLFYSNATELRVSDYGHETGKRFGQHFTCERITPYILPLLKGPRYDIVSKSATSACVQSLTIAT